MSTEQQTQPSKIQRSLQAAKRWLNKASELLSRLWQKRKIIGHEFKHKQRFVVMDSTTYKEKWSFQLSAINLFVVLGIGSIALVLITSFIIAFTPLREFIPGYANTKMVEQTYENSRILDSIEQTMEQQELMLMILKDIMAGKDPDSARADAANAKKGVLNSNSGELLEKDKQHSQEDSELRKEVEEQDQYAVKSNRQPSNQSNASSTMMESTPTVLLFTPMKGKVIAPFDATIMHYGVDIGGAENEVIKAVAPGTVIFSNFTSETGYVIAIQHQGGLISVYKHNNKLLKQSGSVVRAGEPIAYLGNTGEFTSGPHLHFELWMNGNPVNPLVYIPF